MELWSHPTYLSFKFVLSDDDSLDQITRQNGDRYSVFAKRLKPSGDLGIDNLKYFYQFNERFQLSRLASNISLEQTLACLNWRLKTKQFTSQRYQERVQESLDEYAKVNKNADYFQKKVADSFLDYYNCSCSHRYLQDIFDHGLLELALGHLNEAVIIADELVETASRPPNSVDALSANYCLSLGITYSEALNYSKAIEFLSEAIRKNPSDKEAYLQRAIAFFETNQMEEAVQDFLQLDISQLLVYPAETSQVEFGKGFLMGATGGLADGLIELPPSLWMSLQGISHLIWAGVTNPLDVPQNMITAVNEIMDYICTEEFSQIADDLAPEFCELVKNWKIHDSYNKGEKAGYLLGKYGVDILATCGISKGFKAFQELKNLNALSNLHTLSLSDAAKLYTKTLGNSLAETRKHYFKTVKYNYDAHNKHVLGHNDFRPTRSVWDHPDPEGLLRKFGGKGVPHKGTPGAPGFRETVDFKEYIGIWKNEKGTVALPTTRGTIHYGKKGAHIVPSDPYPVVINKVDK